MLGLGWTELLVIGIVALVVIGPKDLPVMMKRVGQFAGQLRRMGAEFQRELNKTTGLNEIQNLRNSVTAPLKATADAIRKEFNTTTATGEVKPSGALKPTDPNVESVVDQIKASAGMAPEAAPAMTPLTGPANPATPAVSDKPAAATKPARVRAAKAPAVSAPAATPPVTVEDIPSPKKAAPRARKAIESPAPVEAIAPKPRTRRAEPAVVAAEEATTPAAAPTKKPAAKTPAARKRAAKKTATKVAAKTPAARPSDAGEKS
jgi:sec-independent protein translocase protein TatB